MTVYGLVGSFLLIMSCMFALWYLSMRLEDVSIVDIFWGPGFAMVTWFTLAYGPKTPRSWLLAILVTVWALRLAVHIYLRHAKAGEDRRYAAMRKKQGDGFAYASLSSVFVLQGVLLWFISLPLQLTELMGRPGDLGTLDRLGIALWGLGFLFEVGADTHLMLFRNNPDNIGQVLDRGLWRFSRHPNYFGECLMAWGYYVIAAASGWPAVAILSPVLLTYLLLKVSGVSLMESTIVARKPAYAAYIERTSPFVPMPPKPGPEAELTLDPEDVPTEEKVPKASAPKPKERADQTIDIKLPEAISLPPPSNPPKA